MNLSITAVLLKWNRAKELEAIETHLRSFSEINEVIIWDNTKENHINYGRYLGAIKAKNDIIYTQDDDCIVRNLPDLISKWDGTQIVNLLKPSHIPMYGNHTMAGWGMLFDRRWADCLQRYIDRWGDDYIFRRECDRIFSILCPTGFSTYPGDIEDFPSANDESALYRQSDHESTKCLAIKRAKEIRDNRS